MDEEHLVDTSEQKSGNTYVGQLGATQEGRVGATFEVLVEFPFWWWQDNDKRFYWGLRDSSI